MFRENQFQQFWRLYPDVVNKAIHPVSFEFSLYRAMDILSQADFRRQPQFGRVDIIFDHHGARYAGEIKYGNLKNDGFWNALKVLGYVKYLKFQTNQQFRPAIIMPSHQIGLEIKIVTGKLGIKLFGIRYFSKGKYWTVTAVEEKKAGWEELI